MNWRAATLAVFALFASTFAVRAETVILVQGYLGSAQSWRASGISPILHRHGWADSGHLRMTHDGGILHYGPRTKATAQRFYSIDLPTEAPIAMQASMLSRYVVFTQNRYPRESIVLVGHSAGGIVARFAMVTNRLSGVRALITIASPHLGTQIAKLGSAIANSPLSWVTPMMGAGTLNRSRTLYNDLSPERPGNLLGWLNRQPHPPTQYISVIRVKDIRAPHEGDNLVYGRSQDMNTVPALQGKAQTVFSQGTHALRASDGPLLVHLLNSLNGARR